MLIRMIVICPIIAATFVLAGAVRPSIFVEGARPKLLLQRGAGEGPAWHPRLGLLFSGEGNINRLDINGKFSVYRTAAGTNGLQFDLRGRLISCEPAQRRVTRTEANGRITVLAERFDGKRFNTPNDIAIDSRNRIYFSDPRYGDHSDMEMRDSEGRLVEGVYRIDLDGTVSRILTHEVNRPNGLVTTADDRYLYVADNNNDTVGGARKLWRFNLTMNGDVEPGSQKLIFDWGTARGPDGMVLDQRGRIYVAAGLNEPNPPYETIDRYKGGVYVLSPEGNLLDFVSIPNDEVTNCTFGGDDLKTLYITALPWPKK